MQGVISSLGIPTAQPLLNWSVTAGFEQSLLGPTQRGQINILLTHTPKSTP